MSIGLKTTARRLAPAGAKLACERLMQTTLSLAPWWS
jgi:hypothetical protein